MTARSKPRWTSDYRQRNLIERFFSKLKSFRRIATRFDKTARIPGCGLAARVRVLRPQPRPTGEASPIASAVVTR
jgi:transposase